MMLYISATFALLVFSAAAPLNADAPPAKPPFAAATTNVANPSAAGATSNVAEATDSDAPLPPEPPVLHIPPAPPSPAAAAANVSPSDSSPPASSPAETTLTIRAGEPVLRSIARPGDQIWLISTRQLGCGVCLDGDPDLQFWHYENGNWQAADLKAFLAADDPHAPTDFYIHGNANTAEDANDHGFCVYHQLTDGTAKDRPIRFVIWSWPTDPGRHPVQLIRSHAYRADTDAWYLGWLLSRMNHRVPIGIAGYSFGARVATGAIHLMGGGELLGSTLKLDPKAGRPMIRAVLLAAAEDDGSLNPGAPNQMAIPTLDRLLLINNGCDSALKHYPLMDRCTRPSALGYVGLATNDPKIEQCDACSIVGTEHVWSHYFCSECLVARMRPYLYLADLPPLQSASGVVKSSSKPAVATTTTLVVKP